MGFLAQSSEFDTWQRAVQSQFQKGGSWISALLVILAIAAFVILVSWLTRIQRKFQRKVGHGPQRSDSQRIFTHLVCNLGLNVPQRQLLESVARDLRLPHPTVLLISETLFDRMVDEWSRRAVHESRKSSDPNTIQLVARTKSRLFPEGVGMVFSSFRSG